MLPIERNKKINKGGRKKDLLGGKHRLPLQRLQPLQAITLL
jgi:hypothetical protein